MRENAANYCSQLAFPLRGRKLQPYVGCTFGRTGSARSAALDHRPRSAELLTHLRANPGGFPDPSAFMASHFLENSSQGNRPYGSEGVWKKLHVPARDAPLAARARGFM